MNDSISFIGLPPQTNPPIDESRAVEIIAVNSTLLLIASIFLLARIYSRSLVQRHWRADDYFIFLAWIFYVAYATVSSLQTRYGAGRHVFYVSTTSLPMFLMTTYICNLLYALYQWAIKMSLALLYLRVFTPKNMTRYLIYTLVVFISIYGWTFFFLVAFQCLPIVAVWNPRINKHCIDLLPALITSSVVSVCIDLALITIVIPGVMRLKLQKAQKIALLFIVNLGWVSIVATILRTVKMSQLLHYPDFLWNVLQFVAWTGLELSTAMICASAPVIRPLLRKFILPTRWMTSLNGDETRGTEERAWTGQSGAGKSTEVSGAGSRSIVWKSISEERLTKPNGKLDLQIEMHWIKRSERTETEGVA